MIWLQITWENILFLITAQGLASAAPLLFQKLKVSEEVPKKRDGSEICIGDRLECDGSLATIKYIGLVPPTKGLWYGVEWDDKDRGKHDGTHEGHTYFKTSFPKSGSFIRPKKANFGVSFMAAVNDRYGRVEDDAAGVITEDMFVVSAQNVQTVVEVVGARKVNDLQSKIDELREVVLRDMLVFGSSMSDDLSLLVPSITDLDLCKNLLSSWKHVADITRQLKNLRSLNVSDSKLVLPDNPKDLIPSLQHVRVLFLNRMELSWQQVLQCCDMFPELEQIHACFNCIQQLSSVEGRLSNIRLVNLESNKLTDWSHLLHLSHLQLLETLILSDNELSSIHFQDNQTSSTDIFPKLRSLTINKNNIAEWGSINELNKLPCLEELRIKSNPLMKSANNQTVRQNFIAILEHLKLCNRTEIIDGERKGAEIDYLKRYGPEWMKAGGSQDTDKNKPSTQFVKQHPGYSRLVQKWGAPEDSEMKQKSATLKDGLIPVKISCADLPDKKILERKLPGTMTIQKLKALINRFYKIDSEIDLTYESKSMNGEMIDLDNDQRYLSYYSIEPGDIIHVKLG